MDDNRRKKYKKLKVYEIIFLIMLPLGIYFHYHQSLVGEVFNILASLGLIVMAYLEDGKKLNLDFALVCIICSLNIILTIILLFRDYPII
ncbi:hypothetical protein [Anaerococcus sp. AGMB09787]|uniref:hypothetical protein n=1 Tax=Anaerococcus sp. AGMB09787 TaxID=2922869 RepID=UPI001FAF4E8D|nr:hypothetical protein [Anaerococcus sp. AGMB09787]